MKRVTELYGKWQGEEAFVVGSGTSLTGFSFERLRDKHTIAINRSFLSVPNCDIHMYVDNPMAEIFWGADYRDGTVVVCKDTCDPLPLDDNVYHFTIGQMKHGFPHDDPEKLFFRTTTVIPAMHLAIRMGAKTIYLLGVDFCRPVKKFYFWGGDEKTAVTCTSTRLSDGRIIGFQHKDMKKAMTLMAQAMEEHHADVKVYNLSAISMCEDFERRTFDEALPETVGQAPFRRA